MPFDNTVTPYESDLTKLLRAAFALIDKPEKWVKGTAVRYEHGGKIRYCSGAALQVATVGTMEGVPLSAEQKARILHASNMLIGAMPHKEYYGSVPIHNDRINHAELCKWWQKAIDISMAADALKVTT